ncbi:hypothetical protein HDV02_004462, partial [Globomyces sp. JEL0801]
MITTETVFLPRSILETDNVFLSESNGFIPTLNYEPLPDKWEKAASLMRRQKTLLSDPEAMRELLEKLPVINLDVNPRPSDSYLVRASCMASNFCQIWHYHGNLKRLPPPDALLRTWIEARKLLEWKVYRKDGRSSEVPMFTYLDLIINNSMVFRDGHEFDISRYDVLVPSAPRCAKEEATFYNTQYLMLVIGKDLPGLVVQSIEFAQDIYNDRRKNMAREGLKNCLLKIKEVWEKITDCFQTISPRTASESYVDPVFFGRLFASTSVPGPFVFHEGVYKSGIDENGVQIRTPGPGGQDPKPWKEFLTSLKPAADTVGTSGRRTVEYMLKDKRAIRNGQVDLEILELKSAFVGCFLAFAGDDGFMGVHKRKLMWTGREITIGGSASGSLLDHTENMVYDSINDSNLQRFQGRCPTLLFTQVKVAGIFNGPESQV